MQLPGFKIPFKIPIHFYIIIAAIIILIVFGKRIANGVQNLLSKLTFGIIDNAQEAKDKAELEADTKDSLDAFTNTIPTKNYWIDTVKTWPLAKKNKFIKEFATKVYLNTEAIEQEFTLDGVLNGNVLYSYSKAVDALRNVKSKLEYSFLAWNFERTYHKNLREFLQDKFHFTGFFSFLLPAEKADFNQIAQHLKTLPNKPAGY